MKDLLLALNIRTRSGLLSINEDFEAEFDSVETLTMLTRTLDALGVSYEVATSYSEAFRMVASHSSARVLSLMEGRSGAVREAMLPLFAEEHGIPLVLSSSATISLAQDKLACERFLQAVGVDHVRSLGNEAEWSETLARGSRLIVKPRFEGSSKGITQRSICTDVVEVHEQCRETVKAYGSGALVQEYLAGREITVALGGGSNSPIVLGALEVRPKNSEFIYDFDSKESLPSVEYKPIPLEEIDDVLTLARRSYVELGCRGLARVDLRFNSEDAPMVLEINPLPGLHPTHSDLPRAAAANGHTYEQLISRLLSQSL